MSEPMPRIMRAHALTLRARPRSIAARIALIARSASPTKIASPIRKWPMLSSTISGKRRDRLGAGEIEPVAGMHFEAERCARASRPRAMRRHSSSAAAACRRRQRIAPGAGMNLDHRRAERRRGLDLLRIGGDEQRHADAGRAQLRRSTRRKLHCAGRRHRARLRWCAPARRSGTMQAACGRVLQRDLDHLRRRRHFEIERLVDLAPSAARYRRRGCGGGPRADAR